MPYSNKHGLQNERQTGNFSRCPILSRGRVKVYRCSQDDAESFGAIARAYNGFDLIIDDGSHINRHQIVSFQILFPWLKDGGIYVIEDTRTSYWPAYGGGELGAEGYENSATSFFKGLVDGLNHAEYISNTDLPRSQFCEDITGIYFEHNLILVKKGRNISRSNFKLERDAARLKAGVASEAGLLE